MSRPDISIDPRLLESAKQEFLQTGFLDASLKSICEHAGVTTGALYKRYKGKEELFCAVVAETVEKLEEIANSKTEVDVSALTDEALIAAWDMDEAYMMWWFDNLLEIKDGFVLLLKCAEGTCYSNFQHDWVEKMTEGSWNYYLEAYKRNLAMKKVSRNEMHMILTGFWTTIYEPFIHAFDWNRLPEYNRMLCRLFDWHAMLGHER